jgi:hypothetical protein
VHGRHYYIEDWYADMAKKLIERGVSNTYFRENAK